MKFRGLPLRVIDPHIEPLEIRQPHTSQCSRLRRLRWIEIPPTARMERVEVQHLEDALDELVNPSGPSLPFALGERLLPRVSEYLQILKDLQVGMLEAHVVEQHGDGAFTRHSLGVSGHKRGQLVPCDELAGEKGIANEKESQLGFAQLRPDLPLPILADDDVAIMPPLERIL